MSLRNLIPYLKTKQHEIVDVFVTDSTICYLRLFHVTSNNFLLMDTYDQKLKIDSSFTELFPTTIIQKVQDYEEDYTEELIHFYNSLQQNFPNQMKQFIFFYGDYMMESPHKIFKIHQQLISSSHHHPYVCVSLEWFYDNFAKLDQQLRPFQNIFFLKVHQLLNQFLNTFSNQNSYFQTFRNHYTEIQQKRKTYETLIKLCIELQDHYQSLLQNLRKQEDYSKVFSISESENRIYKKKKLRQQLQELQPLRTKTRSTLLSYRNDLFYHEIIFIFFVQEVQKHLSRLQSIQFEFETKIQK